MTPPFTVKLEFADRAEAEAWLKKARFEAFDDEGSNDAEHDLLVEVIDTVAAALEIDTCAATDAAELIDGDADAFPDGAGDAIRALVAHYSGV